MLPSGCKDFKTIAVNNKQKELSKGVTEQGKYLQELEKLYIKQEKNVSFGYTESIIPYADTKIPYNNLIPI